MDRWLTIDFGSTYTKGVVFDLAREDVVATGYAPSTVGQDVRIGLERMLRDLAQRMGGDPRQLPCLACSSAAGGLRLAVIGLVPSLSLEAAQRAALGAGAKVVGAFGHKLTRGDLARIERLAPDIVLLAGGIDGGDEETICHNAGALAGVRLAAPIIVAGNRAVGEECADTIRAGALEAILCPNILPEIDQVEVGAVHAVIRELFMTRITRAKGIDCVADMLRLEGPIIPTPSAVLEAARLVSVGGGGAAGVGDLVLVDVGGATTDVHSIASGLPRSPSIIQRGLPELLAKRTVEGDLGMRISAPTVLEHEGIERIRASARLLLGDTVLPSDAELLAYVQRIANATDQVPAGELELALDAAIGRAAVRVAMTRHAGRIREVFTPTGPVQVQEGKDLTEVQSLIGVGGVLSRGQHARFVLEGAVGAGPDVVSLIPRAPTLYLDREYVLFGIGLVANRHPGPALRIARIRLTPVTGA